MSAGIAELGSLCLCAALTERPFSRVRSSRVYFVSDFLVNQEGDKFSVVFEFGDAAALIWGVDFVARNMTSENAKLWAFLPMLAHYRS